ncbi:MAG: hypothetical protein ABWY93_26090 [Mycobacterium sp.]
MRVAEKSRLALAGAALMAAAALVSCSNTTNGSATCPGCGTQAEPEFPTPRPSISTPTAAPPPSPALPPPAPSTAIAAPPPGQTLPPNDQGYVYIETKSGKTRCQLNSQTVGCETEFENSPVVDGEPANGVSITSSGAMKWVVGNLGDIPVVTLDYRTYEAQGWTIAADEGGTRFTNDGTGHGMLVRVQGVEAF